MGIVRFEPGFNAQSVSTRHDFVFAAQHRNSAIKDSFSYCGADHDEMGQIAAIQAIFESAWNRPSTIDGALDAKNACLALLFRTYRLLREAIISQRSNQIVCKNKLGIRK
jgi:hypothetical protein